MLVNIRGLTAVHHIHVVTIPILAELDLASKYMLKQLRFKLNMITGEQTGCTCYFQINPVTPVKPDNI